MRLAASAGLHALATIAMLVALLCLLRPLSQAAADEHPRFEVVPSSSSRSGEGRLDALERNARQESFVSRVFGTDCYSGALRAVRAECRHLDHEGKTRLALAFANCHLYKLGKRTYPCSASTPLKACVNSKDPEFYIAHMQFFSEIDSMCLFVQNQDFQRHTEAVLNLLYSAGAAAAERLVSINASTAAHATALGSVSGRLDDVARQQVQMAASVNDSLAGLDALHTAAAGLDAKLLQSLQHQDLLAQRQAATLQGLAELEAQERRVLAATSQLHELARAGADEFVRRQQAQGQIQEAMLGDLREVAASSKGVGAALQAIAYYQRRSDAVLVHLLGRSYGVSDVLFYVAGGGAAAAAGAAPLTRAARLPLLGLFGGSLLAERCLPPRLHALLRAGDKGQVLLRVPLPGWLPAAPAAGLTFDFKWLLRRACLALGVAATVCAVATFRNVEKENLRSLERIEAYQQAQAKASEALRRGLRAALAAERRAILAGLAAMLDAETGRPLTAQQQLALQCFADVEAFDSGTASASAGRTASSVATTEPHSQIPAAPAVDEALSPRSRRLQLQPAAAPQPCGDVASSPVQRSSVEVEVPLPNQHGAPVKRSRQENSGDAEAAAVAGSGAASGNPSKRSRAAAAGPGMAPAAGQSKRRGGPGAAGTEAVAAADSGRHHSGSGHAAVKRPRREASGSLATQRSPNRRHG